jgi:hypothetical protein
VPWIPAWNQRFLIVESDLANGGWSLVNLTLPPPWGVAIYWANAAWNPLNYSHFQCAESVQYLGTEQYISRIYNMH